MGCELMGCITIHIGFSKTGTTTLQRAVFQNHPQIYYLGKIYKSQYPRQCISADTFDFLLPLLWETDKPLDPEGQRHFFEKKLLPEVGENRIILGSWEGLGQQGTQSFLESMNRLKLVCGQCKLLVTVRNPITRLPSLYLQHLRGNQKQLADKFVTFEEWLQNQKIKLGGLKQIFDYRSYIELAMTTLGQENVGVFLYEEFDSDPKKYLSNLSHFLNIDSKTVIKLAEGERHHTRLFASQVRRMETINRSFIGRLLWRFSSTSKKKQSIGFSDREGIIESKVAQDTPASIDLSPELLKEIGTAAQADNRWLVKNVGLDLAKYSYPL